MLEEAVGILVKTMRLAIEAVRMTLEIMRILSDRVVDPYSFFTDPDPDPELDVGGQYGSGSGSKSNTDPRLK